MKKQHVKLTISDKNFLEEFLSKGTKKVRVQKRALCLQMLDKGMTFQEVHIHLGMSYPTILKWAKKYKEVGLSFLKDKPRPGRPIKYGAEDRGKVTALACTEPPTGYSQWSLRLLSNRLVELNFFEKISHTEVGLILKKMNFSLTEKNNGA